MKPLEKVFAVRRNWPFRSKDPSIAYRNRIRRAEKVLTLSERHGDRNAKFEARRLYVVAACAAFETFWRDVVRDAIDEGGVTLKSSPLLARTTFAVADVAEILGRKVTLGELVAACYTFQTPAVVDEALSAILGTKAFAEFAKWEVRVEEVPRKNRSKKRGALVSEVWKGEQWLRLIPRIERAFAVRHDTVHDAGTRHWLSLRDAFELENAIWQFNDFLGHFVAGRLADGRVA
jgi:hypothetical protein